MDFLITSFSLATGLILLIACLVYLYFQPGKMKKNQEPPTAGGRWPIIGHLHLLAGSRPAHVVLGEMADKYGPLFTIRLGVHRALVVSNCEMAKECLTTNDRVLADRPQTLAAELLGWRQIRKMAMLELLSPQRLQMLKHVKESEVRIATKELYALWAKTDHSGGVASVDMSSWFGEITLNVILKMIVGKSVGYFGAGGEDSMRLRKLFKDFFHLSGRFVVADGLPFLRWLDVGGLEKEMKRTAEEMDVVVGEWLREHKRKRHARGVTKMEEDFMDVLLNVLEHKDGLEGRDLDAVNKATCLTLCLAASDSTTISMDWLLALLVNHPDVLRKAQVELDNVVGKERRVEETDLQHLVYLKAIVKESMRLYPAQGIPVPRQAMEDYTIAGRFVSKGTWLIVNISKIQHDPRVWVDPYEFRPERFMTTHKDVELKGQSFELIPFGSGRRMCLVETSPSKLCTLPWQHSCMDFIFRGLLANWLI